MKKTIFLTLLVVALIGCSNPKEASESNFKAAIQLYLDEQYPSCYMAFKFPTKATFYDNKEQNKIYDEMVKLGLLQHKEVMVKLYERAKPVAKKEYDLTEEGKKSYTLADNTKHKNGGFCFGKASVVEIIDYSEPSEMMGNKISRVNYTYAVSGLPDWFKKSEISELNRAIKRDLESNEVPIKEDAVMILTNKGWKHNRLFGKEQ